MHRGMERVGTLVKSGAVMEVCLCMVSVGVGLDCFGSVETVLRRQAASNILKLILMVDITIDLACVTRGFHP
jgi:hypothetical protein